MHDRAREKKTGKNNRNFRGATLEPYFFFAHSEIGNPFTVRLFPAFLRIVVHVFSTRMNNYACAIKDIRTYI